MAGAGSLGSEGVDGCEPGGAGGRVDAEDHADADPDGDRGSRGTGRDDRPGLELKWGSTTAPTAPRSDAEQPAGEAEHRRLDEELAPDRARGAAPSALRRPISRIRSVTETSMMFITPMPPTSSEMTAMPASITVSVSSTEVAALRSDCWVAIEKSAAAR